MDTVPNVMIHPSADVSPDAVVGTGTKIWHQVHVREGARIGTNCIIGKNVYIDAGVIIGDWVKIQNNVSVYHGVTIESEVFVGPSAVFTNDLYPRSRPGEGFSLATTLIKKGASIGANATIISGNRVIETYSMVAAGSVVTRNTRPYSLVAGNPARIMGYACSCGRPLIKVREPLSGRTLTCNHCHQEVTV